MQNYDKEELVKLSNIYTSKKELSVFLGLSEYKTRKLLKDFGIVNDGRDSRYHLCCYDFFETS